MAEPLWMQVREAFERKGYFPPSPELRDELVGIATDYADQKTAAARAEKEIAAQALVQAQNMIDVQRAEIERLTKRAETAEAERDRAMLSCQDVALRLVKAVAERDEARAQLATRAAAAIDAAEAQGATWGQTRLMVRSAILGGDHG